MLPSNTKQWENVLPVGLIANDDLFERFLQRRIGSVFPPGHSHSMGKISRVLVSDLIKAIKNASLQWADAEAFIWTSQD